MQVMHRRIQLQSIVLYFVLQFQMLISTMNRVSQGIRVSSMLGRLPKFNGRECIETFLRCITKRAKLEHWSNEQTADVIRYLCTDVADSFISMCNELECCDLERLKTELRKRFKINLSKLEARAELAAVEQGNKNVPEYLAELEITAARLVGIIPELVSADTRDDLLVAAFMAGLNPKIKCIVGAKDFQTLFECAKAAARCETALTQSSRRETAVADVKLRSSRNTLKCWSCQQHGHIQRHCPTRAKTSVRCWQCGNHGHPMRLCTYQQLVNQCHSLEAPQLSSLMVQAENIR